MPEALVILINIQKLELYDKFSPYFILLHCVLIVELDYYWLEALNAFLIQ